MSNFRLKLAYVTSATAMGRKRGSTRVVSSAKRSKLTVGQELVVTHGAPRTKRVFADMCGTLTGVAGTTAELRFKLPKQSLALYCDYIGADGAGATVKFSLNHVVAKEQKGEPLV